MDWKLVAQLGGGVFIASLLIVYGTKFLKWLIPFLVDRAMQPVAELMRGFQETMAVQMDHLTEQHNAILDAEKEQTDLLRKMNGKT